MGCTSGVSKFQSLVSINATQDEHHCSVRFERKETPTGVSIVQDLSRCLGYPQCVLVVFLEAKKEAWKTA